ncbi:MAG: HAD-IIIA family hydrolase [Butyrivibrio sp.]|nr:HAD-IIIA family hydrolase [Butyrivibrio sp.]
MKYKAIIFDMDGTVLNTLDDITDSVNVILEKFGLPHRTKDEIRHFVGNGARVLMSRAVAEGEDHPLFETILKEYEAYYQEHCNIKTGPYEHIPELLKELKERGYKLAIVSNKPMGAVKDLNEIYFKDYVSVAIGVTPELRRKPYPDECFLAMKELGVEKEDCIYVGDSDVDFKTSVNTGIKCISCLWGFRTKNELIEAGVKENFYVEDPMEILDLV